MTDMMEAVESSSSEAFVMVDGPSPSEAAHIYDRFFYDLAEKTYSSITVENIQARRSDPDLQGRLYYDELLNLALISKNDENEFTEVQDRDTSQYYPPQANNKEAIIELIQVIQSSSFDRIKKMALWYYLMLDLDAQGEGKNAMRVANEIGLPRSARHAMTGYWLLDRGDYLTAVSYLTEQPDFVSKIIETISPLRYTSTSRQETKKRALALSLFLSLVDLEALEFEPDEDFEEARIVATCWSQGIREAWKQSQGVVSMEDDEGREKLRSRCVGRILEFCFMPDPNAEAIKALLALPLNDVEEEVLCHNMINAPSGIHFSTFAHAVALDVLLVRRMNSGQYFDAILLDRRIIATTGLPLLSHEVGSDAEREKLRKLRMKRQGLIRNAYSVLTSVEKQMLDVNGEEDVDSEQGKGSDGRHGLEMSWENVGDANQEHATPRKGSSTSLARTLTPLTASPALRRDKANESASESFLSAVVRASPSRGRGDGSFQSWTASSLSRSGLQQGSPIRSRSNSLRRSIDPSRRTPSRGPLGQRETSASVHSPLTSTRSYTLPKPIVSQQAEMVQDQPTTLESAVTVEEGSGDGPYSRLAQQLQEQLEENDGNLSIDRILGKRPSSYTLPKSNGNNSTNNTNSKPGLLSFSRPVRRYEAKFEIGQNSREGEEEGEGEDDGMGQEVQTAQREDQDNDMEMVEAPTKRRITRPSKRGTSRGSTMRRPDGNEEQDQDDTSVPGSFPDQDVKGKSPNKPEKHSGKEKEVSSPIKRRGTRRATRTKAQAEESPDEEDEVPEMISTPTMKKSRSGAALSRSRSAAKMASTPVRRSARLSVEPESTPQAAEGQRGTSSSPTKERRSKRGTSKGPPSLASASEREETDNEKEGEGGVSTRSRRRSKMPGSF